MARILKWFAIPLFMGFSRQENWSGLPFCSLVDYVLSEPSTMTRLAWVALHDMAHNFIEVVVHVISLVSFLWLWFSFCLHSDIRIRDLWMLLIGRDWLCGKLSLVLMHGAMLSKPLIQFFVDWWGCVPSLLLDLSSNCGGGNVYIGDLRQKVPCMHCHTQFPRLCTRPPLIWPHPDTPGPSHTTLGQSLVRSLLLSPESWCTQGFVCTLQECVSPVL